MSTANISWFRVAVGLVAALGTVGYMLYDWQFDRERTRLQNLLSAQASELDRQLENLDVVPRVLASDPRLLKVFGSVDTQHVRQANQLLRVIVQQTQISDAFLMDSTGLTIAASNFEQDNSFVGENYSFRPYFKGAMEGELSSQYAVGYTTGVPGFFIAHPMLDGAQILGVVAVKLSLAHLPDSWREQAHQSLLLDSVGIVIQSTDKSMLYAHSRQLSAQETERVVLANNYPVAPPVKLFLDLQKFRASYGNQTFVAAGQSLENQAWQLVMLSTQRSVLWRTATIGFVLLALAALLFFLARSYRYQRLLAFAEQDNARKLENLVQQRTQALEKAQQALIVESNFAVLGRMSAAINHEVNQPLTSLRFNLASLRKMLGRESLNMDEVQQTVVDCDRTTKRISRVVEALRSIARPINARLEPVASTEMLREVVETVRRERPLLSQCLVWQEPTGSSVLQGNSVLLQQALLNLLYNAFDAVLDVDNPRVVLRTVVVGEFLEMHVEDNGPGVEPELQDQLFSPFTQGKNRTAGLGLGLALAQQIAKRHHGELSYRAEAGGGYFVLRVPVVGGPEQNRV